MAWEEEAEVRERIEACNISCEPEDNRYSCVATCVVSKWREEEWGPSYFEDWEVREVAKVEGTEEDVRREASTLAKRKGVFTTVDLKACRLLVDDEGEVEASTCGEEAESPDFAPVEVELGRNKARLFLNKEKVEVWRREYGRDPSRYVAFHPLTLGIAMLNYRFVTPEVVENTCLEGYGVKGLVFEEYGHAPAINEAWWNMVLGRILLGVDEEAEAFKERLATAAHEYAHYLDALNQIRYRGGWHGEHPLQTLASVLTGRPIPAGRELTSEQFADAVVVGMEENFPDVMRRGVEFVKEELRTWLRWLTEDEKETIERVKEAIRRFEEWMEKRFGDIFGWEVVALDDGYFGIKCDVVEWPEPFKEYLRKTFPEDYEELERIEEEDRRLWEEGKEPYGRRSWEYFDKKEELNVRAVHRLFREFVEELDRSEEDDLAMAALYLEPVVEREGGWVTIKVPVLKIDINVLNWECDPEQADISPPPEW